MLTAGGIQAGLSAEEAAAAAQAKAGALISGTQQAVSQLQASKSMLMGMAGINSDEDLASEGTSEKIAEGKQTVSGLQDLVRLAQGVRDSFFGENGLISALSTLKNGTSSLSGGTSSLAKGLHTLNENMPSLTGGAQELSDGAAALSEGSSTLEKGTSELDQNMPSLKSGADALGNGIKKVAAAISKIAGGSKTLSTGADTLKQGTSALDAGAGQLQAGLGTLDENSSQLTDGTAALKDGTGKLVEGSSKLADGMKKFDEEGVGRIVALFNGDLTVLMDRMEALKDAGDGYNSFSGIADGMDGSVRFVIKSDSILPDNAS